MRKLTYRFLIWTLVLVFLAVLVGCEQQQQKDPQQQTMSPKKAKLVAAQNIQLKKDIAARDKEIEKQKKLVADCKAEKEKLKKQLNKQSEELMAVIMASMDKNAEKIRTENTELKKQVEQLKKQLAEK